MPTTTLDADVAVVGGSLAGCAAAQLLAEHGLRVAVLEQHADPAHYKKLCGHYLQAGTMPALRRLGLCEPIEALGGVRNGADACTPFGWIRRPPGAPYGYSIRRQTLDPLVRARAMATPGVEWLAGLRAVALAGDQRVTGVVGSDRDGRRVAVRARLVIGADGRNSTVAQLAQVPAQTRPNQRFCYFAYYADLPERGRIWRLDGDVVLSFPNDGDLTAVAVMPHKARLASFKAGIADAFAALVRALPEAPALDGAERVSPFRGYVDYPNRWRPPAPRPGLALIGDAALSLDPAPGVGCGWALQSAVWLAEAVAAEQSLDRACARYACRHAGELDDHRELIVRQSLAAPPTRIERAIARAAVRDARTAARLLAVNARMRSPRTLRTPRALLRVALAQRATRAPSSAPAWRARDRARSGSAA